MKNTTITGSAGIKCIFNTSYITNAKEIRVKIYKHMAKELKPENPIENLKDLQKAGYRF